MKSAIRDALCLPETDLPQCRYHAPPWAGHCLCEAGPWGEPTRDGLRSAARGARGCTPVAGSLRGPFSLSPQTFTNVGWNKVSSMPACLLQ